MRKPTGSSNPTLRCCFVSQGGSSGVLGPVWLKLKEAQKPPFTRGKNFISWPVIEQAVLGKRQQQGTKVMAQSQQRKPGDLVPVVSAEGQKWDSQSQNLLVFLPSKNDLGSWDVSSLGDFATSGPWLEHLLVGWALILFLHLNHCFVATVLMPRSLPFSCGWGLLKLITEADRLPTSLNPYHFEFVGSAHNCQHLCLFAWWLPLEAGTHSDHMHSKPEMPGN